MHISKLELLRLAAKKKIISVILALNFKNKIPTAQIRGFLAAALTQ